VPRGCRQTDKIDRLKGSYNPRLQSGRDNANVFVAGEDFVVIVDITAIKFLSGGQRLYTECSTSCTSRCDLLPGPTDCPRSRVYI